MTQVMATSSSQVPGFHNIHKYYRPVLSSVHSKKIKLDALITPVGEPRKEVAGCCGLGTFKCQAGKWKDIAAGETARFSQIGRIVACFYGTPN